jgi:hypothetical protein
MVRSITALLLSNLVAAGVYAQSLPSAEMVVARYVDAIGGKKNLDAIQNLIILGTYTEHGQSVAAQLARMRPF